MNSIVISIQLFIIGAGVRLLGHLDVRKFPFEICDVIHSPRVKNLTYSVKN